MYVAFSSGHPKQFEKEMDTKVDLDMNWYDIVYTPYQVVV